MFVARIRLEIAAAAGAVGVGDVLSARCRCVTVSAARLHRFRQCARRRCQPRVCRKSAWVRVRTMAHADVKTSIAMRMPIAVAAQHCALDLLPDARKSDVVHEHQLLETKRAREVDRAPQQQAITGDSAAASPSCLTA